MAKRQEKTEKKPESPPQKEVVYLSLVMIWLRHSEFRWLFFLVIVACLSLGARSRKGIEARFTLKASIDNLWYLQLRKDQSYTYWHWSGLGPTTLLDSGSYQLLQDTVTFQSAMPQRRGALPYQRYALHRQKKENTVAKFLKTYSDKRVPFSRKYWLLIPHKRE
ncbi:MAG: hypothetical protein ACFB10_03575 [Salibacteraceae bacterium]